MGHYKSACTAEYDRSTICFRCGENGHKAALCQKEMRCVVCEEHGYPARHRLGSYQCSSNKNVFNVQVDKSDRRPTPTFNDNEDYPM